MALLGDLVVNLGLNSKKFSGGLTRASSKLKTFGSGVARGVGQMAKFGAAATAAGVALGAVFVRSSLESIDSIAKLSDRLGIATEDITAFQHAGQLMGVSATDVNKGLEQLTKRLGEVATLGKSEAKPALDALGLTADQLANMPLADALGLVSDRMNGLATQSDKAAVANALFGRAGLKMLNFLSLGSAGLKDARAEAEQLGITFSRVDAAKVEAANDSILRFKQSLSGIATQLTIAFGPTLESISTAMTAKIKEWIDTFKFFSTNWSLTWDLVKASAILQLQLLNDGFQNAMDFLQEKAAFGVGAIVGFFIGLKDRVVATFKELGNVAVAFGVAFKAAFDKILQGTFNPKTLAATFTSELIKTFANQKNVKTSSIFGKSSAVGNELQSIVKQQNDAARKARGSSIEATRQSLAGIASQISDERAKLDAAAAGPTRTAAAATATATGGPKAAATGPKFAGALRRGSAAAFSAINAARGNPTKNLETINKKQLKQQQKTTASVDKLVDEFLDTGVVNFDLVTIQ